MTTDERIGEQLHAWVEGAAPRVRVEEIWERSTPSVGAPHDVGAATKPGRRRALLLVAAAIVVVLASALLVTSRRGSEDVPLVTDDVGSTTRHHYQVELLDASGPAAAVEHAEYGGPLHRGLVWTARARLAAYGRTDATVVASASGGAVISTVDALSADEVALLLGTEGRLEAVVVGEPTELARCPDGPGTDDPTLPVAVRSGSWPTWGPVVACTTVAGRATTFLGTADEGDPGALVLEPGVDVAVAESGAQSAVHADLGSPPLAGAAAGLCGDDTACFDRVVAALDGTVIDPLGGPGSEAEAGVVADGLSRERAEILRAVLLAGGYPAPVTVMALADGSTPDTMRPWDSSPPDGSAPPTTDGGHAGSGAATLEVSVRLVGGPAPGIVQPWSGATVEVVDTSGSRRATTDANGVAELEAPIGTVTLAARDSDGPACDEPTTVVVVSPGRHRVGLVCPIA